MFCQKCQSKEGKRIKMTLLVSLPQRTEGWNSSKEFKNFEAKPLRFKSKKELLKYCRERKLTSGVHS